MHNRAVSNTLGYVLLFAVVITSLTVVGTVGVGSLEDARDGTLLMNAEQSMQGLTSAQEDLHREGVPRRTSQIRLSRGSLESGEETDIRVDIDSDVSYEFDTSVPSGSPSPRAIQYRSDGTRIVSVAGAVFRLQESGAVVVKEPNFVFRSDATIIPVINTTTADPETSMSGSGVGVILTRTGGTLVHESSVSGNIEIEIVAPTERQAELWHDVLNDDMNPPPGLTDPCSVTGDTVTCTHAPNSGSTVIVRSTDIRYEMNS